MRRLALSLVLSLSLSLGVIAHAQSPRPGMRLTITRVAPSGGFTASGLLVVHTTTIDRQGAPECGVGAVRIHAEGVDAHGSIRRAHFVTIASEGERAVDVGPGECDAHVELRLDDGTTLTLTRGTVRAHLVGGTGLDATVDGSVIDAGGVPTTVTGHIVLSPAS